MLRLMLMLHRNRQHRWLPQEYQRVVAGVVVQTSSVCMVRDTVCSMYYSARRVV